MMQKRKRTPKHHQQPVVTKGHEKNTLFWVQFAWQAADSLEIHHSLLGTARRVDHFRCVCSQTKRQTKGTLLSSQPGEFKAIRTDHPQQGLLDGNYAFSCSLVKMLVEKFAKSKSECTFLSRVTQTALSVATLTLTGQRGPCPHSARLQASLTLK